MGDGQDKCETLEEQKERLILEYEKTIQDNADEARKEKAVMQEDAKKKQDELDRVAEFRRKEAQLEEDLAEKTRLLEERKRNAASSISDLERKHVQEKDRLKKEMLAKLRETKANLLRMTDSQLDTTTKRTIAENEQMSSELAWQSKETEKLIRKNDKLVAGNAALRRELSLQKQTQEEFARKVNVYQKTIKTLLAKMNDLDAKQQTELARMHLEDDEKERKQTEGFLEREGLEEGLAESAARLQAAHEEIDKLTAALQEVESKYAHMLALQDEAVKFTLQCLTDMQQTPMVASMVETGAFAGAQGLSEATPSLETLDVEQREFVMKYLLEQLRAYQEQLKELELHHAWKAHTQHTHDAVHAGSAKLPRLHPNSGMVALSHPHVWAAPPPPFSLNGGASAAQGRADAVDGVVLPVASPLRDVRASYGKRSKDALVYPKQMRHRG